MNEELAEMPLSTLMALRDLGRDDLRRANSQVTELILKLEDIDREISSRGNSNSE